MLSLQKCRSLLGTDCKLTDSQIEQLRQEIYAFSDVAVEAFCAQRRANTANGSKPNDAGSCLAAIPQEERQAVEERAAILEFEGHLKKPEAERQAFGEWAQSKKPLEETRKPRGKRKLRKPKSL